jgi:hypothetical protein
MKKQIKDWSAEWGMIYLVYFVLFGLIIFWLSIDIKSKKKIEAEIKSKLHTPLIIEIPIPSDRKFLSFQFQSSEDLYLQEDSKETKFDNSFFRRTLPTTPWVLTRKRTSTDTYEIFEAEQFVPNIFQKENNRIVYRFIETEPKPMPKSSAPVNSAPKGFRPGGQGQFR